MAFSVASATTAGWWYLVCRQRRINYENFHKNYDFDKEYERMKKAGIFTGIPAEWNVSTELMLSAKLCYVVK